MQLDILEYNIPPIVPPHMVFQGRHDPSLITGDCTVTMTNTMPIAEWRGGDLIAVTRAVFEEMDSRYLEIDELQVKLLGINLEVIAHFPQEDVYVLQRIHESKPETPSPKYRIGQPIVWNNLRCYVVDRFHRKTEKFPDGAWFYTLSPNANFSNSLTDQRDSVKISNVHEHNIMPPPLYSSRYA